MKVIPLCNWTDSRALARRFDLTFGVYCSPWFLQWEFENPDAAIIFNDVLPYQEEILKKIPKERILGFLQEPPDHNFGNITKLMEWCGQVVTCIGTTHYSLQHGASVRHNPGMFPSFEWFQKRTEKTKKLSFVVSGIRGGYYENRIALVEQILKSDLNCDIYGRGLNMIFKTRDRRMKGQIDNKADALYPYEYSIAIENGEWIGYASEKITDCFGTFCVPIYRGAPNIQMMFPDALQELKGNQNEWLYQIAETIRRPYQEYLPGINAARKRVMNEHNLLKIADDYFAE